MTLKDLIIKFNLALAYLKSKWIFIVAVSLVGLILGYVYASTQKVKYIASTTFVLEEGSSGGGALGQYAGVASMMGVDIGGGSGGIFKEDNLLELYTSRSVIRKALLSLFPDNNNELLIDEFIKIYDLKKKWPQNNQYQSLNFYDTRYKKLSRLQDSIIIAVTNEINLHCLSVTKPDKKTDIIQVKVTSVNERFSKRFDNQIVNIVNQFYIETKTKRAAQNLSVLQYQTDSVRGALNGAITNVATSIDINPNPNPSRQVLRVPSQKRQLDAEANKAILTELVKNLEIAKVSLRKETPLIVVIDEPIYPLNREKVSRLIMALTFSCAFSFLTIVFLLLKRAVKNAI